MRLGFRTALAMAGLLASLSLVAWRQGRAYEVREALDDLSRELAMSQSSRLELQGAIRHLRSRERIAEAAERLLELRAPEDQVIILRMDQP